MQLAEAANSHSPAAAGQLPANEEEMRRKAVEVMGTAGGKRKKGRWRRAEGERASGSERVENKRRRRTDPERGHARKLSVGALAGSGNPRIMPVGGCVVEGKQKSK